MTKTIFNLLDLMRVQGTAYIAKNLTAPWGTHINKHPHLARFHLVISGSTWIGIPCTSQAEKLECGDIAIIPEGKAHTYFDNDLGLVTTTAAFPTEQSSPRFELFDKEDADTYLLCGYFEISDHTPPAILSCLPDLLISRTGGPSKTRKIDSIVNMAREELLNPTTLSQTSLNRLTEMLCIHVISDWLEGAMSGDQRLSALADPKTHLLLSEIHNSPASPWTVMELAQRYGKSRTAFNSQFKLATGCSPMSYVRRCRIKMACRMLDNRQLSIDEIAFKSGYTDTNAFNRAFKREMGSPPGAYKHSVGA